MHETIFTLYGVQAIACSPTRYKIVCENRHQSNLQIKTEEEIYGKVYAEIQNDQELFDYKKKNAIELMKIQSDGFVENRKKPI